MTVADETTSRVESAYDFLLGEITAFRFRTGAPLSENRIANQLGISRTPVREALQRLEKEGLVKRTDNARFSVSQLTPQEANDACDFLEVLDAYIARKVAAKLTPEVEELLRSLTDQMVKASSEGDVAAWSQADTLFHRALNATAGNALVTETVKETRRRVHRFWLRATTAQHRLEECSLEHVQLTEAIIAKDYDAIDTSVTEHIGHMRERVLDLLESAAVFMGE